MCNLPIYSHRHCQILKSFTVIFVHKNHICFCSYKYNHTRQLNYLFDIFVTNFRHTFSLYLNYISAIWIFTSCHFTKKRLVFSKMFLFFHMEKLYKKVTRSISICRYMYIYIIFNNIILFCA